MVLLVSLSLKHDNMNLGNGDAAMSGNFGRAILASFKTLTSITYDATNERLYSAEDKIVRFIKPSCNIGSKGIKIPY